MTLSVSLSVILPVLNEAEGIAVALATLAPLRQRGVEMILVDGGSTDATVALSRPLADHLIAAPRGRAAQMNAGAKIAKGDVLLFLHADTQLPRDADRLIAAALANSGRIWGRFDVRMAGGPVLALIARFMNLRSRLTGIATGDQAIFVRRDVFESIGGYPAIALMEDVALSARLRSLGRPLCLRPCVTASPRRWQTHGVVRTVLLMWRLRLAYYFGADPSALARRYGYAPHEG